MLQTQRTWSINSLYATKKRFHDARKDDRDPRNSVLQDLDLQMEQWIMDNEKIVILADMNSDINSNKIKSWCATYNLKEIITDKHKNNQEVEPTYHKGSLPIDGVFITPNITVHKCGYLPFGALPSDHRCIWIELKVSETLGSKMSPLNKPQARRLKCSDPRIMKKWEKAYKRFIKQHNLHARLFAMESCVNVELLLTSC